MISQPLIAYSGSRARAAPEGGEKYNQENGDLGEFIKVLSEHQLNC